MRRHNDIKAPDGYLLGGIRLVRRDGTILFQRGYWKAPADWVGERVWVHEEWKRGGELLLEAAHPGLHIYEARCMEPPRTVFCEPAGRPDAKPGYRNSYHKAWAARNAPAQAMSTGTAKTPKAVEGRSPASAVGEADAPNSILPPTDPTGRQP